jgi:hypothetical protein
MNQKGLILKTISQTFEEDFKNRDEYLQQREEKKHMDAILRGEFTAPYSTLPERQEKAIQDVLEALTKALTLGIDPDSLMRKIIARGIEVVRG